MLRSLVISSITFFTLSFVSCKSERKASVNQNTGNKCSAVVFVEAANNTNTEVATLSVVRNGKDSAYSISIQSPADYSRNDVPCEGNLFMATRSEYPIPADIVLVNFRWLDSTKLMISYSDSLSVLKKKDSLGNISVVYKSHRLRWIPPRD